MSPRPARAKDAVALDHLPAIQVDAPAVDVEHWPAIQVDAPAVDVEHWPAATAVH